MNHYIIVNNCAMQAYGIAMQGEADLLIHDLGCPEKLALELVRLLNDNDVSPVHFWDVIENFFS